MQQSWGTKACGRVVRGMGRLEDDYLSMIDGPRRSVAMFCTVL